MFYLFYFIEQCAEARVTLEGGAVYTGGWLRGRYCIYIYICSRPATGSRVSLWKACSKPVARLKRV